MRHFKQKKKSKNTIIKKLVIVFFCALFLAIILFNDYGNKSSDAIYTLANEKTNKILYQFFSDLITDDVINKETIQDIMQIVKNSKGEILTVDYNLEKTYKILTDISTILKDGISNLENGIIDVSIYDKYLKSNKGGLILNVPLFLSSNNPFLNNLGPKIPIMINFNETLLTNVRTKVTEYGFNNALLEIYVTVEMQKNIITPLKEKEAKFEYDILIGALVINGTVPNFYPGNYEAFSSILDVPLS